MEDRSNAIDWDLAARELVRALRGRRSQREVSEALGYRSNPVAEWEAGRRQPSACEALRLAQECGVDVHAALQRFHAPTADLLRDLTDDNVAAWLQAHRATLSVDQVSNLVGRTRHAVGRWLTGETRPRLPAFLQLIEAITPGVVPFVDSLVDAHAVTSLGHLLRHIDAARRVVQEAPWSTAVRIALTSPAYQALPAHRPGWLAHKLNIDAATEARCLALLEEAGMVTWDGHRFVHRDVAVVPHRSTDDGVEPHSAWRHWAAVAHDRSRDPGPNDLYGGAVFTCTQDELDTIREAVQDALSATSALRADADADKLAVLQFGVVQLADLRSAGDA